MLYDRTQQLVCSVGVKGVQPHISVNTGKDIHLNVELCVFACGRVTLSDLCPLALPDHLPSLPRRCLPSDPVWSAACSRGEMDSSSARQTSQPTLGSWSITSYLFSFYLTLVLPSGHMAQRFITNHRCVDPILPNPKTNKNVGVLRQPKG